jgi:hypothetical protein
LVHVIPRNLVLTHTLKRCASQDQAEQSKFAAAWEAAKEKARGLTAVYISANIEI